MQKKKTRVARSRETSPNHERKTYAILIVLVLGFILAGVYQYFAILVIGSVAVVGYFGWQWWLRRATVTTSPRTKTPTRRKRKPRVR